MPISVRATALAAALSLLAACGDGGTGPSGAPSLTIGISGIPSDPYIEEGGGGQSVGCLFTFSLTATGDAGASATWTGATLRFYAGAGRTSPIDSLMLSAAETTEAFGSAGVAAGERKVAQLGFLASVPFGMEAEFRYRVQGSEAEGAVKSYVSCVPPVNDENAAPPRLSEPVVQAPPGPLEPGDTLKLTWTAESAIGLWETGVVVSGAFEQQHRVAAAYRAQTTHTVELVVPANAQLGEPVHVQVYAVDLLVRVTGALPIVAGPVVDLTAPVLHSAGTTGTFPGEIEGQYPAGRDMHVNITVHDNHELAWVVYELGPVGAAVRDSVPYTSKGGPVPALLPTRPEWAGAGEARLYVRDRAGNRSRTVQSEPGALHFYPLRTVPVRAGALPFQSSDHAVDPRLGHVYVAAAQQPRVFIYSLQSLAQLASVTLPGPASQLDLSPGGDLLVALIPTLNALAVVDVAGLRVAAQVPLNAPGMQGVYGFRVAANGRVLVMAGLQGGGGVVLEYDLATGVQRVRTDAPQIPLPDAGVYASLDQSRLLLGAGCVYDAQADAFGPCASLWTGNEFNGSPFYGSGTGAFWGQSDRVLDASLQHRATVGSLVLAMSRDDRFAYVGEFGFLQRVRIADGLVEDGLLGGVFLNARVSADGRVLVSIDNSTQPDANPLRVMELP